MVEGIKHLIQCHCILPQYRNRPNPVFHKFIVFSVIENDTVNEKIAQCPNCGVLHKVTDLCKSEILIGKDENRALVKKTDVAFSLPQKVIDLLETYSCDLPTWEHCAFIIKEKLWGSKVKIVTEDLEESVSSKFLVFDGEGAYNIVIESGDSFIERI
tara:strand:+ start:159 stop:629 length:471 start_codon:yes stop_codon:yes gene_type:complete